MNRSLDALPERCDVLVVGAGPAGSAAARELARNGSDVVLVDRHAFPRDKVCGDGLIPDALRALERLGVRDTVLAEARQVPVLRCIAPRGGRLDVPGTLAVLPRRRLDAIVCGAAVAAGARMFAPVSFVAPRRDGSGRVVGATVQHGGTRRDIEARWVVLATGAETPALIAAGMCERRTASAIALRGYVANPAMAERFDRLEVVWNRRLGSGYGWIFPCGDGVFNIGVGAAIAADGKAGMPTRRGKPMGLRALFAAFTEVHDAARELVAGGRWLGEPGEALKGAPLRCSLAGARLESPGLLVAGEAAGSTYALTGEGIGKAMETGLHAADAILGGPDDAAVRADYAARIAALRPRFAVYDDAHRAVAHPWLLDLLVWSAQRSPGRLQRLAGVLDESRLPTDATSVRGIVRRLFDRR